MIVERVELSASLRLRLALYVAAARVALAFLVPLLWLRDLALRMLETLPRRSGGAS